MSSISYQLPDLYSLSHTFTELRTNRFCHRVTLESESWLTNLMSEKKLINNRRVLDEAEREKLHGLKAGLMAALCFPTCDASQLRFITDFLSVLICSNTRLLHASHSDWQPPYSSDSGIVCLGGNDLFK